MAELELLHLLAADGRDPVGEWIDGLADRRAAAAVLLRIGRLRRGLYGDCRSVGGGGLELRIDVGPGYRACFARPGPDSVLLLAGGDKRRQHDDIESARRAWASARKSRRSFARAP